ncbi:MAG: hypothetical protein U9P10_01915 [Thermodesulfobacteriota bacterium]|nr:hypothetical protein [Thermodesulfobacteriota bacterium]
MSLKYVEEYRDGDLSRKIAAEIRAVSSKPLRLMEVCGTHTMSIFRHGIKTVLPDTITLLSGPGCPVCVTSQRDIDAFIALSMEENVTLTTFGDLMRVALARFLPCSSKRPEAGMSGWCILFLMWLSWQRTPQAKK